MSHDLVMSLVVLVVPADSAADAVRLADGRVVLGQALGDEQTAWPRPFAVRRAWAAEHFPDRIEDWERDEERWAGPAREARLARLRDWKAVREAPSAYADPLTAAITAEIARLEAADEATKPPLLVLLLQRREVGRIERRRPDDARKLRQGWKAGFEGVEEMPVERLIAGLASRGFAADSTDPAPIDDWLPIPRESDAVWLQRRSATEASHDVDLRFIRYGDLVLPESSDPTAPPVGVVGALLGSTLGSLLEEGPPPNPLEPIARTIEAKGRTGLVVTELDLKQLDRATVTITLYARIAPERWEPALRRAATVMAAGAGAGAGDDLAADPQVAGVFRLLESIAPGGLAEQTRQQSLAIGAATRRALGQARESFEIELARRSLELHPAFAPPMPP